MFQRLCPVRPAPLAVCLAVIAMLCASSCAFGADPPTPRLDLVQLFPTKGDTNTVFMFLISYFGTVEPSYHDLYLDGSVHPMTKSSLGPLGGRIYLYQTRLTAGAHKYRFRFKAGEQMLYNPGPTANECHTSPTVAKTEVMAISGRITTSGAGLEGVAVTISKSGSTTLIVKTSSDGRYTSPNLTPGTWTVTPAKVGYAFERGPRQIPVPPSMTTCDFTAVRK
jgi:hypothetical protein